MDLQQAIGHITDSNGKSAFKKNNILEILENYGAFDESKAFKFIFKTIISEGVMDILISGNSNSDEIVSILSDNYGFEKEVAKSVVIQILNGLNTNEANNAKVDEGAHMTFKGVPICGHVDALRQKLEELGYAFTGYFENGVMLNGEFAGKSGCEIYIIGSICTQQAWKIIVYFPEHKNWYALKNEYFEYKERFMKKYGIPDSFEYFEDPYEEGDGYELSALYNEKCSFKSFFKTDKGYITVSMASSSCVSIDYEDSISADLAATEKESKANFDI